MPFLAPMLCDASLQTNIISVIHQKLHIAGDAIMVDSYEHGNQLVL